MDKRKKRRIFYLITTLVSIIFLFLGVYLMKSSFNTKKVVQLNYIESNTIDYNVYLKENSFFEDKYLPKGKSYITSLIDFVSVSYYYNIKFYNFVDGSYNYKIVATIYANKQNDGGYYWKKDYVLKESETLSVSNTDGISIAENLTLDYDSYNQLFNSFKKEYGITADGILEVSLQIDSKFNNKMFEKQIPINAVNVLKMPLSQLAIDATISTDDSEKEQTYKEVIQTDSNKFIVYRIGGVTCIVLSGLCILIILNVVNIVKQANKYKYTLNKILNNYDSIIVNTENAINLNDYNVIRVKSFEELLDAHSEVRMPINYIEEVKNMKSKFILIKDNNAWVYILESAQYTRYRYERKYEKKN